MLHVFFLKQDYTWLVPQCQAAPPTPDLEEEGGYPLWPLSKPGSFCKGRPKKNRTSVRKYIRQLYYNNSPQ